VSKSWQYSNSCLGALTNCQTWLTNQQMECFSFAKLRGGLGRSGAVTSLVTSCSHCSAQLTSFICGAGRFGPKVYPYKACLVTTEEATWPCGYEAGLKIPNSSSALTMPPAGFVLAGSLWSAGSLVISSQLVVSGSTPRLHLNIVCP